uniref:Uncharacterized protein n=1 Tax=Eutreptiella gymnastica TaxID=73025 RepID=A0A7S4FZU5_9EUGL|mmetsp:Transcript_87078/g.145286  ORF Transcript_87078/g.145286 Transcript_87078/m.145286 type:complete len:142 (+) Transcript_87078:37-462(+)|eukprot:CAMPEP_0174287296 /NCGR_PEP_ID=MMETSP0809-20121228/15304_1 /TAXON_ID=73025 ORGANISM="Eutreptiella gymnastica-like, Strain CCMP1594" /NCGR_SAMPLE_ID=MMETSP0809 /ASSEMBLY_ACC=CAM_ASM_000658 /LENGTH=141 /DNA_ID=CAMNT_0015383791 /DNA_START=36 /DNA_END=461 /DNA_ORIENTATION=+
MAATPSWERRTFEAIDNSDLQTLEALLKEATPEQLQQKCTEVRLDGEHVGVVTQSGRSYDYIEYETRFGDVVWMTKTERLTEDREDTSLQHPFSKAWPPPNYPMKSWVKGASLRDFIENACGLQTETREAIFRLYDSHVKQ